MESKDLLFFLSLFGISWSVNQITFSFNLIRDFLLRSNEHTKRIKHRCLWTSTRQLSHWEQKRKLTFGCVCWLSRLVICSCKHVHISFFSRCSLSLFSLVCLSVFLFLAFFWRFISLSVSFFFFRYNIDLTFYCSVLYFNWIMVTSFFHGVWFDTKKKWNLSYETDL